MLAFYRTFPDRSEPDEYERTLPDVFPDIAPGSFTWSASSSAGSGRRSTTTSGTSTTRTPRSSSRWPRRCSGSPRRASTCCGWTPSRSCGSALGTNSQNQPEVHDLLQAFRAALRIAAPAVAFKAEAIVAPRELVRYLGSGRHEGKECDLAYHNVLMVLLWSALPRGAWRSCARPCSRCPPVPPGAGWLTYVRCHDDIGWAITREDAARVGEDAHLHRRFLADFYAGDFAYSFARGARFQPDPASGEARTSGTTAALAGVEDALARGDTSRSSWRCGGSWWCTRSRSRTAGCR